MFVNIDDTYFVRKNIELNKVSNCLSFISNQTSKEKSELIKAYNLSDLQNIRCPFNVDEKNVDIAIKSKFNQDYKFINFNKAKLFYEFNSNIKLFTNKINQFHLERIKFFPRTYVSNNLIFQELALGNFSRPEKLLNFDNSMLKNVAKVIQVLSSIQHKSINVINYLKDFKFSNDKDRLNNEILKTFSLVIKKFSNKNISLTLTHGDFKIEHLYTFNNELEYLIDWENVGIRSIFFDLLNFFVPWFVKRSYDYFQLKNYIFKFIQNYNPNLLSYMSDKYDLYFSIFALERYIRLHNSRNINFNMSLAYQRYNQLFLKISKDLVYV